MDMPNRSSGYITHVSLFVYIKLLMYKYTYVGLNGLTVSTAWLYRVVCVYKIK